MAVSSLETTDIFRGAFFLCMGGDLTDIRFRQNGKQIASFLFTGPDLAGHDKAYRNGNALVNPVQFRESLNHLRDILFKNLKQNQNACLSATHRQREMRYDRKRKNRADQNHCRY